MFYGRFIYSYIIARLVYKPTSNWRAPRCEPSLSPSKNVVRSKMIAFSWWLLNPLLQPLDFYWKRWQTNPIPEKTTIKVCGYSPSTFYIHVLRRVFFTYDYFVGQKSSTPPKKKNTFGWWDLLPATCMYPVSKK